MGLGVTGPSAPWRHCRRKERSADGQAGGCHGSKLLCPLCSAKGFLLLGRVACHVLVLQAGCALSNLGGRCAIPSGAVGDIGEVSPLGLLPRELRHRLLLGSGSTMLKLLWQLCGPEGELSLWLTHLLVLRLESELKLLCLRACTARRWRTVAAKRPLPSSHELGCSAREHSAAHSFPRGPLGGDALCHEAVHHRDSTSELLLPHSARLDVRNSMIAQVAKRHHVSGGGFGTMQELVGGVEEREAEEADVPLLTVARHHLAFEETAHARVCVAFVLDALAGERHHSVGAFPLVVQDHRRGARSD